MTERACAAIGSEAIEAVADRGYYSGEEILACEAAGITVYLPKPMTSGVKAVQHAAARAIVRSVRDLAFASDGSSLQAIASKTSLGREPLIGRRIGT